VSVLFSAKKELGSSGDTIPNCLGELGEIRERTDIAADGHPAQGHRIKMGVFHKIGKSRHSD